MAVDTHKANELALCLINEDTKTFPYDERVRTAHTLNITFWAVTMNRYADKYRREWETAEPFEPSTILAAAAEVADYYERHVAEFPAKPPTEDMTMADQTHTAPSLSRHEGSWVATHTETGEVRELFNRESAIFAALSDHWTIETIGTYLGRINTAIKSL